MEPKFRNLSLTIVDFIGVFIPGIFLLSIIIVSHYTIFNRGYYLSPLDPIWNIFFKSNSTPPSIVSFLVVGSVIGYLFKPHSLFVADIIANILFNKLRYNSITKPVQYLRFPYPSLFENTEYYKKICAYISEVTNFKIEEMPGHSNPFAFCKRVVKIKLPELWEECEHLEAEVRMLGTFFLFSIISMFISLLAFILQSFPLSVDIEWFLFSIVLMLKTGHGFQNRRIKEVNYLYLYFIIVISKDNIDKTVLKRKH